MISFGTDFVAGKNRVPNPATGKIALVTRFFITYLFLTLSGIIDFFILAPINNLANGEDTRIMGKLAKDCSRLVHFS
jgi:hypothetical protein